MFEEIHLLTYGITITTINKKIMDKRMFNLLICMHIIRVICVTLNVVFSCFIINGKKKRISCILLLK